MSSIPQSAYHKKLRSDFKVFLWAVHRHLGLPDPTPLQYAMADWLQYGPKRSGIMAYRGAGKSHITAAYVIWVLLCNADFKILVVSASKDRADAFSIFVKRLIWEMKGLEYLRPNPEQRQSNIAFDVGPAKADQSPSVKSVGITGQITGSRADLIVGDDIEVLNNAFTQVARDRLAESVKEFDAVLKPLPHAKVVFLGTPQTEDSLYTKLPERGYQFRIWPARVPSPEMVEAYGDSLAPEIHKMIAEGRPVRAPTDPDRFDEEDLMKREASYGKAGFAMQFMLSTQLSDMERFPLKVRDLIIQPIDLETAPMRFTWGPMEDRALNDLPCVALRGDRFYPPMRVGEITSEYTGRILAVDPSGRGADETGYAVVYMLNGYLFVPEMGGLEGGYDDTTLGELAAIAKKHKVNEVIIESNFGDGMFSKLFAPVLRKVHPCGIEEIRHHQQKERRIIDTLEPVMNKHKLVIDPSVIEADYRTVQKYEQTKRQYRMLIYQMTRISYEKGVLRHDDRLDALAIGVGYWVEQMDRDDEEGEKAVHQEALEKELNSFMEAANRSPMEPQGMLDVFLK